MIAETKVQIQITLDAMGNVNVAASSKNLITIFGMFEMAKKALSESSQQQNHSGIVVPQIVP